MSFPLENARLCMDCDTVFAGSLCPSCSSESYFPLSRWIRPALDELRTPQPQAPLQDTVAAAADRPRGKTARNASLLLAGSGLAYALWRAFMSKGRSADRVEQMAARSKAPKEEPKSEPKSEKDRSG